MPLHEVCDGVEQLTKDAGLKVVIIDYLQLLHRTCLPHDDYSAWMLEITHTLRLLAVKLDIAIVVLSQVDRGLEKRPNKRPILSDLGRCGDIEQDASLVVFIYRDDVYNEDSPDKNVAEIIITKNNYGPTGTSLMSFNGRFSRFEKFDFSQ
jgi:replicative DNA helicase